MNWQRFIQCRSSSHFEIRLWCGIRNGEVSFYRHDTPNADCIEISMYEMNFYAWEMMETECSGIVKSAHEQFCVKDYAKMCLMYLRLMFREWNLDCPMTFDEYGVLDDPSFERLLNLHPQILEKVTDTMYDGTLTQEDEEVIARQSALLFGKAGSVSNPHPMISLYCTLSEMWEKFGLNYFDLMKMPLREKNALRMIARMEGQMRAQQIEANTKSTGRRSR